MKSDANAYDVIVIGAGIGGLVCGCYLAKAGMRVLIAEQHHTPGGYCTSFKRKGFIFDAAAHSFGGCREGGITKRVLKELGLEEKLKIQRYNPSDIIIAPDYKIHFWSDVNKTVEELQRSFPHESGAIHDFFLFLRNAGPLDLVTVRNKTFKELLDHYFADEKLKSMLSVPVVGNGGLPPSQSSAFSAIKIYTEFLLDGGYYPEDSMQSLSDALAEKFVASGGQLLLSCRVKRIKVKDGAASGVILDKNILLTSRYVVSNCDARQTYFKLLDRKAVNGKYLQKLKGMIPSHSVFVLYLGIDEYFKELPEPGVNVWVMPHYDVEQMARSLMRNCTGESIGYMVRLSPNKNCVQAFVTAPFKSNRYWRDNKKVRIEEFIQKINKVIPGLSGHVIYKDAGTPHTMFRFTLNYKGAAYGWAGLTSHLDDADLKTGAGLSGLYAAGHWSAQAHGITGVAYTGLDAARLILRKDRNRGKEYTK